MTFHRSLTITPPGGAAALSPAQAKFNGLIQKIETQRQLLDDWADGRSLLAQRSARDLRPLLDTWQALNTQLAHFLDQRVDQKGFSKAERRAMREIICALAQQLMDDGNRVAMQALYDRNCEAGPDANAPDAPDAAPLLLEDASDPALAREAARQQHQARRKAAARQARERAELAQASRPIRDVFRKLAGALHPDRETDAGERQRKTALMQRVNQAYGNQDLPGLLRLQLEVEQIDQATINTMAEDRLVHLNKVLAEQLAGLQEEARRVEDDMRSQFGLDATARVSPSSLMGLLRVQVQGLKGGIHQLRLERRGLEDDASLKRWLKVR